VLFTGIDPQSNNYGTVASDANFECCTANYGLVCGNACFYSRGVSDWATRGWTEGIYKENFSSRIGGNAQYYACDLYSGLNSCGGQLGTVNFANTSGSVVGPSGPWGSVILDCSDVYSGHNNSICTITFNGNSTNTAIICNPNSCITFNNTSLNCGVVCCACTGSVNGVRFLQQGCYLCNLSIGENNVTDCFDGVNCVYRGYAQYTGTDYFGAKIEGNLIDKKSGCIVQNFDFCDASCNCGKVPVKTYFYNTAQNNGTISKSAMFKNASVNSGVVALTGVLCNCSYNQGCICSVVFNNYAYNGCNGTFTTLIAYNSLQKGLNGAPILGGDPPQEITI
jgi:hypothetical protein